MRSLLGTAVLSSLFLPCAFSGGDAQSAPSEHFVARDCVAVRQHAETEHGLDYDEAFSKAEACERTQCVHFVPDTKAYPATIADVNACGERDYWRPLHWATWNRQTEVVRKLLRHNADPNVLNCPGFTPLDIAVGNDDIETASALLSSCAHVEAPGAVTTPLIAAASRGSIGMVRLLLSHDANPNTERRGQTALYAAIENGRSDVVWLLLTSGSDPNLRPTLESTPLATPVFLAVSEAYMFRSVRDGEQKKKRRAALEIIRLLVAHGANISLAEPNFGTPTEFAMAKHDDEIVEALTSGGAKAK